MSAEGFLAVLLFFEKLCLRLRQLRVELFVECDQRRLEGVAAHAVCENRLLAADTLVSCKLSDNGWLVEGVGEVLFEFLDCFLSGRLETLEDDFLTAATGL